MGTSKGLKNNASNANKAQKEAEKYKRTLLGFDQINKMDDNSSSDTGSGGGQMLELWAVSTTCLKPLQYKASLKTLRS